MRCIESSDDRDGADEPYAVFVALDLSDLSRSRVSRTRIFRDVEPSSDDQPDQVNLLVGGQSGRRIADPDQLVVLVGLMESDDSGADRVRDSAFSVVKERAKDLLEKNEPRASLVSALRKAFRQGLERGAHVDNVFDSDDDLIGGVAELRMKDAIDAIRLSGAPVELSLTVGNADTGRYELSFALIASK